MRKQILNSKGEPIVLNHREEMIANNLTKQVNSLGYEIDITSLTTIMQKVSEQKFFQIAPADYLPVRVGEGAWSTQLTTYRSFALGDDFDTGVLNTSAAGSRLASADAGVDSLSVPVKNWAKEISWSLFDLEHASKSGNWDLVTSKEKARKKNWDLGIQKIAFLGGVGTKGLLTQSGITPNTTVIPKAISSMSEAELNTFLGAVLEAYRSNCKRTAMPTHFVVPESDYLGLAKPSSATYPIKSKLQLLMETFQIMTGNPDFKILPCAYGDAASSDGNFTENRYALYNYEEESLRMDIPVDYNSSLANSINNFHFSNVGYGQFTGALAYRPLELVYFDIPA